MKKLWYIPINAMFKSRKRLHFKGELHSENDYVGMRSRDEYKFTRNEM